MALYREITAARSSEEATGVFSVPIKVRNWQNRFLPPEKRGEDVSVDALVDSGATQLALPAELIERLKLEQLGEVPIVTADGGRHTYRVFGIAELEVQGRVCYVRAIELPHSLRPLLGAVPLEEMDWHIAPGEQRLVPNPESPEGPLVYLLGVRVRPLDLKMTTQSYTKPLPQPDPITRPFWESVKAHAMRIQRCGACGRWVFYPRALCPACFSAALAWTLVSGRGVVHAFTIPYRHPSPAFQPDLPYVVAIVELEEGARLMTNLVGVPPDPQHVRVGMPVEVLYDDVTPEVTLPKFRSIG